MNAVFLKILNMSISAGWLVFAVLVLRLLLKKAPKWITVLLWGIVAFRLICPFSFESKVSLVPSKETVSPQIMVEQIPTIDTGIPIINNTINPMIGNSFSPKPTEEKTPLQIWIPILVSVWVAGILCLLAYTAFSYWRIRRRVRTAILLRDNIFQSETVVSPFVLGILKPKIYLNFHIPEQEMAYVIAHEQAHIRRRDHWWKPFGFLLLTLHWFNPLIWLGYVLLCRDIELACDEKVVKAFDREQRANYSEALLNCSVNRRILAACPLAFGEVDVKNRVRSVLHYKKPAFWLILAALIASITVAVCFLTDPISTKKITLSPTDLQSIEQYLNDIENIGFIGQNTYTSPNEIESFYVFYGGAGLNVEYSQWAPGELKAVATAAGWPTYDSTAKKIPREAAEAFVLKKTGLSLADFSEGTIRGYSYVEAYDAFYCFHGLILDWNATVESCVIDKKGQYVVHYTLSDKKYIVTLTKTASSYQFVSNVECIEPSPESEDPFLSIFTDGGTFYSASQRQTMRLSDYKHKIWKYAIADLNGDGQTEVAIEWTDGGMLILWKDGNTVNGFESRSMSTLCKDGSYYWSSHWGRNSMFSDGCSILRFSGNACTTIELTRQERTHSGSVTYYVYVVPVSQEEYNAAKRYGQKSVDWMDWPFEQPI